MSKWVRVYDPDEKQKTINLVIQEDHCPGLLELLSELPYRTETPLIRGVLYQWFLLHQAAGTLEVAVEAAWNGAGGFIASAHPANLASQAIQPKGKKRSTRQRTFVPKPKGTQGVPESVKAPLPGSDHPEMAPAVTAGEGDVNARVEAQERPSQEGGIGSSAQASFSETQTLAPEQLAALIQMGDAFP